VAYLSRKLTPAECNYEIHDKELLAVIQSLEEWRAELVSVAAPFQIMTDHKNLEYFMTTRKLSERQVRWAELLSRFRFSLIHRPGRFAHRPDALSRRAQDAPTDLSDERHQGRVQVAIRPEWVGPLNAVSIGKITLVTRGNAQLPAGSTIFEDDALASLWDEGMANDDALPRAYEALKKQERAFPPDLGYKVSIAECSFDSRKVLLFRGRIWVPQWEPLQTTLI